MSLHQAAWQIIGTTATAVIGVVSSLYIANKNRSQLIQHSKDTLDVQKLATARSASTFIAEKRQKWMDDLRADLALYLALSTELTEGWKRLFSRLGNEWDTHPNADPQQIHEWCENQRVIHEQAIASRESEHYQLLMRVSLRLNANEGLHNLMLFAVYNLRKHLAELAIQAVKGAYSDKVMFAAIEQALGQASMYAHVILKAEWQRLKYDVAAPDDLLRDILAAREREIAEDLASFEDVDSERSPLSTGTAAPGELKGRPTAS